MTAHMRGTGSEPIELAPGNDASRAAREAALEQWAWRRVRTLRLFYTHFTVYVIVNFFLLLIDISTPGDPWFYKVLLGWGLFIGLHAAYTYELLPWANRDWEQRKVQELIDEQRERMQKR